MEWDSSSWSGWNNMVKIKTVKEELIQKWWKELCLLSKLWENNNSLPLIHSTSSNGESTFNGWLMDSKKSICQEWSSNNCAWLCKFQKEREVQATSNNSGWVSNHSSCKPWTTKLVDVMKSKWELSQLLSQSLRISELNSQEESSKTQNSEEKWLSISVNNKTVWMLQNP